MGGGGARVRVRVRGRLGAFGEDAVGDKTPSEGSETNDDTPNCPAADKRAKDGGDLSVGLEEVDEGEEGVEGQEGREVGDVGEEEGEDPPDVAVRPLRGRRRQGGGGGQDCKIARRVAGE